MQSTNSFKNLNPNETLSYIYINEEEVNHSNFTEVSLIGCNVCLCRFNDVILKSSDIDGTVLNNCSFNAINWSYTDFCSITVYNSSFIDTDFSMSTMSNCKFDNCKFVNCNFDHIAMNNSSYNNCKFENIVVHQSSTYSNYYNNCSFFDCCYKGNMYYNMLIDCNYSKTNFEMKLFSANFWGVYDDFESIGFDRTQQIKLEQEMLNNKLLINCVTSKLNFEKEFDIGIIQYISSIYKLIENNILIRDEQVGFVYSILNYLIDNKMISPITCVQMLAFVQHIYSSFSTNEAFNKCEKMLNLILNKLSLFCQNLGQQFSYTTESEENKENIIKIIFEQEPEVEICKLINDIKNNLKIDGPEAKRIKTEKGSFLEFIQCYDSLIGCLQLIIDVLGIGITIKGYHKKGKPEVSDEIPDFSTEPNQEELLKIVSNTIKKQQFNPEVNTTIQVILKNDIIAKRNFRGYKKSNIRSIEIITQNN